MKVFVKFFPEINLGDDLFLKILFERYPQVLFVITGRNKYKDIFKNYHNVQVIEEKSLKRNYFFKQFGKVYLFALRFLSPLAYIKTIKDDVREKYETILQDCDVFLSIGGSIFMQRKILPTYGHVELYKFVNQNCKHSFFIGCNFGPYMTESYRNSLTDIFKEADDVCFRDRFSWEKFSNLDNVRYAPDVVFNLETTEVQKIENSVGFSIIKPRGKTKVSSYIENYARLIQFYINKGEKVFLFSFCSKQEDDKTIENVLKHVRNSCNITKVFYEGNISEFIHTYSKVEKMYCGRFHSMILSMLFQQHFFPIIYSEKMTNVLDDLSYCGSVVNMKDFYKQRPEDLDNKIYENKYGITNEILNSKKQFAKLDNLLKNEL